MVACRLLLTIVLLLPTIEAPASAGEIHKQAESAAAGKPADHDRGAPVKIALIGGGITAAATAAFLRKIESETQQKCQEESADKPRPPFCARALSIEVFEASDRLGGRLEYVVLPGEGYVEMGGATVHKSNLYMQRLIEQYMADHRHSAEEETKVPPPPKPLVWNIERLVFNGNEVPKWYHVYVAHLSGLIGMLVSAWDKLYDMFGSSGFAWFNSIFFGSKALAAPARPAFESGYELLGYIGMRPWVHRKMLGVLDTLVQRPGRLLVESAVLSTYTQDLSVQSLAGFVSLGCIFGPNVPPRVPHRRVVEHILGKFVNDIRMDCAIEQIIRQDAINPGRENGHFRLEARKCDSLPPGRLREQVFDYVVVATPLSRALRIFRQTGESSELEELSNPYYEFQDVFITFVHAAEIKEEATLIQSKATVVTSAEHAGSIGTFFLSSCGSIRQDTSESVICQLKTGRELSDDDLASLFRSIHVVERRHWKAYPYFYPFEETPTGSPTTYHTEMTKFEVLPGLFYPNAFEGLFSCMEGQAVAAQNVAQLLMNSIVSRLAGAREDSSGTYALETIQ